MEEETACGELTASGKTAEPTAAAQGGRRMVSPEDPAVAVPPVLADDDEDEEDSVLGDGEEDEELADEPLSDEEEDELYCNSDSEFEEYDEPPESGDGAAAGNDDLVAAPAEFLAPPRRFASVQSAVGFMRLSGEPGQDAGGAAEEIVVDYRYTLFSRPRSGGAFCCGGTRLHRVRFLVPSHAAADPLSSLPLASAALADLFYPRRFRAQLQALWSGLVAAAAARVPPPGVARARVTVDVGILQREGDLTPESMARVSAALPAVARRADESPAPARYGMELHLPAPVPVRGDEGGGTRPTKRRRFAGEECAICYEVMEKGLVAWPRCSHVFHGGCLEPHLLTGTLSCPLCRSELTVKA